MTDREFIYCRTYRTSDLETSKIASVECSDCARNVLVKRPTRDYKIFEEAPWFVHDKCPQKIAPMAMRHGEQSCN